MNSVSARNFIVLGALMALLSVMIGAFGAHGLKATLALYNRVDTFETAAKYQMYHSLAMVLVGVVQACFPSLKGLRWVMVLFAAGFLFFCGSLYIISLTGVTFFGAIAPLGGLSFMLGWLLLAWKVWKFRG